MAKQTGSIHHHHHHLHPLLLLLLLLLLLPFLSLLLLLLLPGATRPYQGNKSGDVPSQLVPQQPDVPPAAMEGFAIHTYAMALGRVEWSVSLPHRAFTASRALRTPGGLRPHQTRVDGRIMEDVRTKTLHKKTLSYTPPSRAKQCLPKTLQQRGPSFPRQAALIRKCTAYIPLS